MIRMLRNMARRRVRTGLTVFGIAIGVFALTVMGAMSENFNVMLDGALKLSSRTIDISSATRSAEDRITPGTVRALKRVDGVKGIVNTIGGILAEGDIYVSMGPAAQVYGLDPTYIPDVFGTVSLQAGRWLDSTDFRATVIGSKIASTKKLAVGSTLTWRKNDYTVVGVMAETNTFPDNFAVMPFETVRRDLKYGPAVIGGVSVVPEPNVDPEDLARRINDEVPKVRAKSPKQTVDEVRQALAAFNIIMLGGAILAAVVGGLAVVNTMIMSVNERTREIGIKKALGAEDSTIIREYLGEAALMGLLGGAAGAWAGWAMASILNVALASSLGGSDVWLVTPRLLVLVLAFAMGLGLLARLDPVQALRAE